PCPLVAQLFHHRPPSRTAELSGDKLPILTAGAYASDRADLRTWAELATLEEAARFAGRMRPFRQARALGFCGRVAAEGGADQRGIGYRDGDGANGARVASRGVVVMPRDGAITFRDIVRKLTVLRITCDKCGRSGQYRVDRLIMRYGIDAKLFDWSDEITADCPRKQARSLNDQSWTSDLRASSTQTNYCFKSEEASGMTCSKGSGRIKSCPTKGRS